jgi:hypothetical protein
MVKDEFEVVCTYTNRTIEPIYIERKSENRI